MNETGPDDRRRISAASFEINVEPASDGGHHHTSRRPLWIVMAGILGLCVLFVVAVLPRLVTSPQRATSTSTPGAPAEPQPTTIATPATIATPGPAAASEDPVARSDTQDALKAVLEQIARLEAMQAEQWAKSELHALRQRVGEGETAYREKRYVTAQNIYLDVSKRVERLLAEVPDIAAALLDAGQLALDTGRSADATAAFEQVLAMDPEDAKATRGLARAATLDQVNALIAQAEGYEALDQADKAVAAYREALALDADATRAQAALTRIKRVRREREFMRAMSAGIAAMEKNDFAAARKAFGRAREIDAGNEDVARALEQLEHRQTSVAIENHLTAARKAEAGEQWHQALKAYDAALALDKRLSPAVAGRKQAHARRELDSALRAYLSRPDRLGDSDVHAQASAVLARAEALNSNDRRLSEQVTQLARHLKLARTPVAVQFYSDQATRVTVYRVGELGTFETQSLELLPGSYTAVGQRDGYRDVRVEFSVSHAATAPQVEVRCMDKLAFGS